MSEFTRRNVVEHVESNLCGLKGLVFDSRDNVADVIRDELDSGHFDAPSVNYNSDAWDIVNGGDFASVDIECDFSECENAIACVNLEADAILREAYNEELDSVVTTIARCIEQIFNLSDSDFTGASRYTVEEVRQCGGARLGFTPHTLEFDLNESEAESVCVWLPHRELYFKVHGMEFSAQLVEVENDE